MNTPDTDKERYQQPDLLIAAIGFLLCIALSEYIPSIEQKEDTIEQQIPTQVLESNSEEIELKTS